MNDRTSTDNDDVRAGDTVHAGDVEITRVIGWLGPIKTVDELFPTHHRQSGLMTSLRITGSRTRSRVAVISRQLF